MGSLDQDRVAPWLRPDAMSWGFIAAILGSTIVLYNLGACIYNLYFHPLAKFPGPFLNRASRLPYVITLNRGKLPTKLLDYHNKYGPVVRIAPHELAFEDPAAWKDIYGHRVGVAQGAEEMGKADEFYRFPGIAPTLLTERRAAHGQLRREMAHGFSDRSMRAQESLIAGYINLLMQRLRERCTDPDQVDPVTGRPQPRSLDLVQWYNWTTFDVIGDLAFGESFGCLERLRYDPWVAALHKNFMFFPILTSALILKLERFFAPLILLADRGRRDSDRRLDEKLGRRLELKVERPDLIEGLVKKKNEGKLSYYEVRENASLLIIAGSETTATLLSGVTYLLLTNPETLAKVTAEVRSTFASEADITLMSVGSLTYMLACLNEALRMYPPVPGGLPRIVPEGGATIAGQPIPGGTKVSIWHWAVYHSPRLWTNSTEYKPERFLGDPKYASDHQDILQPFSFGPRNCIGRNLAYAEMRLILARILYSFDLELADKSTNWLKHNSYVLWDKPALNVKLTPVER